MAYQSKNLSVIAYANGFTFWHYATEDTASIVDEANYFDDAADMLRVGDVMLANLDTSGDLTTAFLAVSSNSSGCVQIANMTSPD